MVCTALWSIRSSSISEDKANHKMNCAEAVKAGNMLWKASENRVDTSGGEDCREERTSSPGADVESTPGARYPEYGLLLRRGAQIQRCGIHAVAQAGGRRTVVKYV